MEFIMNLSGPTLYILIFVVKTIEVSMATIRLVLNSKGERIKGALLGFFEVMIWLLVVSSVLNNITKDPFKIVAYAAGFALGNFLGVFIESKIALGTSSMQVVSSKETGDILSNTLRAEGFGVTIIDGKGIEDSLKTVLFIQLKRRNIKTAAKKIKEIDPKAYIIVNDVSSTMGGFLKK